MGGCFSSCFGARRDENHPESRLTFFRRFPGEPEDELLATCWWRRCIDDWTMRWRRFYWYITGYDSENDDDHESNYDQAMWAAYRREVEDMARFAAEGRPLRWGNINTKFEDVLVGGPLKWDIPRFRSQRRKDAGASGSSVTQTRASGSEVAGSGADERVVMQTGALGSEVVGGGAEESVVPQTRGQWCKDAGASGSGSSVTQTGTSGSEAVGTGAEKREVPQSGDPGYEVPGTGDDGSAVAQTGTDNS